MLVIDNRQQEPQRQKEYLETLGVPSQIVRLSEGDYAFLASEGLSIGIEHKEIRDYINSLNSGRLEDQLLRCQESYNKVILLLEGVYTEQDGCVAIYRKTDNLFICQYVYPNTLYKSIQASLDRIGELGIQVEMSSTRQDTLTTIASIYKQRLQTALSHCLLISPPRRHHLLSQEAIMATLAPRMPMKAIKILLEKYRTVWDTLHASDEELLQVQGIGKKIIDNMKGRIGKP